MPPVRRMIRFLDRQNPCRQRRENFEEQRTQEQSQKKAKQLGWSGPAGMPLSNPDIQEAPGSVGGSETKEAEEKRRREMPAASSGGECSGSAPTAVTILHQPLPHRRPPKPENAAGNRLHNWSRESRRISTLLEKDPLPEILNNLPTLRETKDPDTAQALATDRDRAIVMAAARSVVSVSSVALDGKVIRECTGIVVSWNEATKCARILTCFDTLCGFKELTEPKPKLHVRLPNQAVSEGQFLFYNAYYDISLIEIIADAPLDIPSFGSSPNYDQEVFVLARDNKSNLMVRRDRISSLENLDPCVAQNCHMFLCSELTMNGDGASVIDHDGNVVGLAFYEYQSNKILAISTILTCIEMWMKFSRIARPMHGLRLRTIERLNVTEKERVYYDYKIDSGYIVDQVENSIAEMLGIRRGVVIVSFDKLGVHSLPRLEDLLLSVGLEFLQSSSDSSTVVNFQLEVYDLIGRCTRSVTLPVQICDDAMNVMP